MLKIELTQQQASDLRGLLDLALKHERGGLLAAKAAATIDEKILQAANDDEAAGAEPAET